MLTKLRCWAFGHPVPGELGEHSLPIRLSARRLNLPFLEARCPRCGIDLPLHFIPGTRGNGTPAHTAAQLRWYALAPQVEAAGRHRERDT